MSEGFGRDLYGVMTHHGGIGTRPKGSGVVLIAGLWLEE